MKPHETVQHREALLGVPLTAELKQLQQLLIASQMPQHQVLTVQLKHELHDLPTTTLAGIPRPATPGPGLGSVLPAHDMNPADTAAA